MHKIRIFILYIAKYLGVFHLSRIFTANGLRIICYHGFALDDEHLFRPQLFMRGSLFKQRLAKIADMGFAVISLDKAVEMIKSGRQFSNQLVITIDDGWQGVSEIAWPLLRRAGFDWTLYLTSYYAQKQTQVMNVALQYLCWKTSLKTVDFSDLDPSFKEPVQLRNPADGDALSEQLVVYGLALPSAKKRQDFVRMVANRLQVDQTEIERKRLFYLIDGETVKILQHGGADIQLHSHRHSLGGINKYRVAQEIADNRNFIAKSSDHPLKHFCYPSGFYRKEHLGWLAENGVISATTCAAGLNYSGTSLLELKRFLDGENISAIEFEAELSGFNEIMRRARAAFSQTKTKSTSPKQPLPAPAAQRKATKHLPGNKPV